MRVGLALLAVAPCVAGFLGTALPNPALAHTEESEATGAEAERKEALEDLVVYGRAQRQLERAAAGSEGRLAGADLRRRTIGRVGELLEAVPGLIATQHSGPGKGNQFFLRGFNLDHGTDFAVFHDGVPLNLRTHGHGQGYIDLNMVIPEVVESIDFRKGPYRADVGDFGSAGASFLRTVDRLPESIASVTVGEDRFVRGLVAANLASSFGDGLIALEGKGFEDPFDLDADLLHVNGFAKFTRPLAGGTLRASLLGYRAEWTSTDQIPRRAIRSPDPSAAVSRLGFIDPDLGGETTRVGATIDWREEGGEPLALTAYFLYSDLELFSNFTYFADFPVQGDEFEQVDERFVWGGTLTKDWNARLLGRRVALRAGAETRFDLITDIGLFRTAGRQRVSTVRRDDVREWSGSLFAESRWSPSHWMSVVAGVRGDLFAFDVDTRSGVGSFTNGGSEAKGIVNPKLSVILRPHDQIELYLNGGGGFHSNDARGTALRVDPATGAAGNRVDPVARQWGAELGARWQRGSRVHLTAVAWFLDSESELVFVGDAGTTEAQGGSQRYGVEVTGFLRPVDWIAFDASYAWSDAAFDDLPTGADRIPGAIETVLSAGATLTAGPLSANLRLRHFGAYPLVEDNTQRAGSTTLVNLGAQYRWGAVVLGLDVINLFDSTDSDIEYFFGSRLAGEAAPVDDVHLHPVQPRQVRGTLSVRF